MRFPGVLFPKLGDSCLVGLDKLYSDNCPDQASGTLPSQYEGQRVGRAWEGKGSEQVLGFWQWVGTGCLSSTLPPLSLLPGSLSSSRSSSLGLFFAGLGCPWGGEGVGRNEGEKEQLCQHNPWSLCSCPPWPGCHPLLEGPVPGHNGDQTPGGPPPFRQGRQVGNRPLCPHPFPFILLQSQQGLRAAAGPRHHFRDGETESRRKDTAHMGLLRLPSSCWRS